MITMNWKNIIGTIIIGLISFSANSQTYAGVSQCGKCGFIVRSSSQPQAQQAIRLHLCSKHGMYCPTNTTTYYNPVATKSPEQIKKEREEKELQEAAEDANDHGVDCYDKKDWITAINYFKVALEYVPNFEDAIYNLKKAEQKLDAERQRIEEEERQRIVKEEEEIQKKFAETIQVVTLPPALNQYMEEADKIIVPPPSWESNIEEQVTQIRLGQNGESNLMLAAFDQVCTIKGLDLKIKLLLIGAKSTFAAQDEADIVAFRQNAWYERTLQVLKDPKRAPLLIAAIKALREKKPMPPGITPELERMAKATQDPSLGNSSVHMAMSTMLSKESRAAFFQTFKMEAIGLISDEINGRVDKFTKGKVDKFKSEAWEHIEKRVDGLKLANDIIDMGRKLIDEIKKGIGSADKNQGPSFISMIQNKTDELVKSFQTIKPIPEAITNVMSFFDRDKADGN